MFELSYSDLNNLSLTFEHPEFHNLTTLALDLSGGAAGVKCATYGQQTAQKRNDELASRIIAK